MLFLKHAHTIWTTVSFNPNFTIRSSFLFFSISFAPHIDLTIALLVLLKIAIWPTKYILQYEQETFMGI